MTIAVKFTMDIISDALRFDLSSSVLKTRALTSADVQFLLHDINIDM